MNVPIDISDVTLKTERLVLRPFRYKDLEDFYEYARVDGVGQMAGWQPHENIEVSKQILDRFVKHKKTFALEYDGKVIGSLGIEEYDEGVMPEFNEMKNRELGFVLSKDYWGMGLMPEAVNEVIRYLFEDVGLDLIVCKHFTWNTQSEKVQKKCGFRPYSSYEHKIESGGMETSIVNILTRVEWLERKEEENAIE
ncbi:MAG: GNAT family N-acetyltransferase [Erysipelotrichaceae bacterium]|nr:GNAT family N-acetyltransferase [Erysipelotrichaceae bacterium]